MPFTKTERQTLLSGVSTSAAPSTAVNHGVFSKINNVDLDDFFAALFYLVSTTPTTGGAWDLYIQVPVVPNPVSTNNAHWMDIAAFEQNADSVNVDQVLPTPAIEVGSGVAASANAARIRTQATLASDGLVTMPLGDQIRIVSKTGALVSAAAVFSLHITGYQRKAF